MFKSVMLASKDSQVENMFSRHGCSIVQNPEYADAVVFPGGADICPILYGQKPLPVTHPFFLRDLAEIRVWKSLKSSKPKLGICRGAQLGNVLSGGSMWQNVNNHSRYGYHDIVLINSGDITQVNTLHHQMCRLTDDASIIALANESTSYEDEFEKKMPEQWEDVEAFFYQHTNFLGVQWHPEYNHEGSTELFFDLIKQYYFTQ